jgi:hypothetical protein
VLALQGAQVVADDAALTRAWREASAGKRILKLTVMADQPMSPQRLPSARTAVRLPPHELPREDLQVGANRRAPSLGPPHAHAPQDLAERLREPADGDASHHAPASAAPVAAAEVKSQSAPPTPSGAVPLKAAVAPAALGAPPSPVLQSDSPVPGAPAASSHPQQPGLPLQSAAGASPAAPQPAVVHCAPQVAAPVAAVTYPPPYPDVPAPVLPMEGSPAAPTPIEYLDGAPVGVAHELLERYHSGGAQHAMALNPMDSAALTTELALRKVVESHAERVFQKCTGCRASEVGGACCWTPFG